jgi:hypothetical protein
MGKKARLRLFSNHLLFDQWSCTSELIGWTQWVSVEAHHCLSEKCRMVELVRILVISSIFKKALKLSFECLSFQGSIQIVPLGKA